MGRYTEKDEACLAEGCESHFIGAYGLCRYHLLKCQRGLMPPPESEKYKRVSVNPPCSFKGCTARAKVKKGGLCLGHSTQIRSGVDLRPLLSPGVSLGDEYLCGIKWCKNPVKSYGLCGVHASIAWRFNIGPLQMVELLSDWRCGICGGTTGRPSIDHDHSCCPGNNSCGKCIRGVLCSACNILLGKYESRPERYHAIMAWAESPARMKFADPNVKRYEGANSSHPRYSSPQSPLPL